ncbi:MAG: glycosyltransferase family 2 protein, partial [Cyanobacteriota bacterium]
MFLSVVIPTYNRLPILQKCLRALEEQKLERPVERYEVIVVDDGSSDDTVPWLQAHREAFPHVRLFS